MACFLLNFQNVFISDLWFSIHTRKQFNVNNHRTKAFFWTKSEKHKTPHK